MWKCERPGEPRSYWKGFKVSKCPCCEISQQDCGHRTERLKSIQTGAGVPCVPSLPVDGSKRAGNGEITKCAGVAISTCPSSLLTRIESPLFRLFLQRRLRLPLVSSRHFCCTRLSSPSPRGLLSDRSILVKRGFVVESAAARVRLEAGGRVVSNLFAQLGRGVEPSLPPSQKKESV